jgi:hypothetical protein
MPRWIMGIGEEIKIYQLLVLAMQSTRQSTVLVVLLCYNCQSANEWNPFGSPGTDAASCMAAAFAISSLLYTPTVLLNTSTEQAPPSQIQNSTYASKLLTHAEDLYAFAMNSTIVGYAER